MSRRVLSIVFPWYVLWRIKQLTEQPYSPAEWTPWDAGYDRALFEVRMNMGLDEFRSEVQGSVHS